LYSFFFLAIATYDSNLSLVSFFQFPELNMNFILTSYVNYKPSNKRTTATKEKQKFDKSKKVIVGADTVSTLAM